MSFLRNLCLIQGHRDFSPIFFSEFLYMDIQMFPHNYPNVPNILSLLNDLCTFEKIMWPYLCGSISDSPLCSTNLCFYPSDDPFDNYIVLITLLYNKEESQLLYSFPNCFIYSSSFVFPYTF